MARPNYMGGDEVGAVSISSRVVITTGNGKTSHNREFTGACSTPEYVQHLEYEDQI